MKDLKNKPIILTIKFIFISIGFLLLSWGSSSLIHYFKYYNKIGLSIYSVMYYVAIVSALLFVFLLILLIFLWIRGRYLKR
ncbi:MAG: hypothetical protein K0R51_703 [Cytophagaceae bacterium]|jgi:hypothetical protein|nr:hypothetical protein [Cytophagaceae bacterium]